MSKRKALGKGLDALIPASPTGAAAAEVPVLKKGAALPSGPVLCPIEEIAPSPHQPRKRFDEKALAELARSIKENGLLQPILVRPREGKGARFELVAGERRWRAAQRAGLTEVPVLVKKIDGDKALELSLIENLQREDLNPIEEAEGFRWLSEEFGCTQEEVADKVGKDRSTVANALRLLKLPAPIRKDLEEGKLSAGHARAILSLESNADMNRLRQQILKHDLSVRQAEALARRMAQTGAKPAKPAQAKPDVHVRQLEEDLQRVLGAKVSIHFRPGKPGKIEIAYSSLDDLDRIIARLKK